MPPLIRPPGRPSSLWSWDGSAWRFRPSCESQRRFLLSRAPDLLFTGPWGAGGKSIGLCVKAYMRALQNPGAPLALCRKTRADMDASTIAKLRMVVPPRAWEAGVVGGQHPERLDLDNGSHIDFLGFDRRERFLSADYLWVGVDECTELSLDDWEYAAGRLRWPDADYLQIAGATNPGGPRHFLYSRFQPQRGTHAIEGALTCEHCEGAGMADAWYADDRTGRVWAEREPCPRCDGTGQRTGKIAECVLAAPDENLQNLPVAYRDRRNRLTGVRRERNHLGHWVAMAGMVFDLWSADRHIRDRENDPRVRAWDQWGGYPPPSWPRVRGIDFGHRDPFVCVWFALDPDGRWWLYRQKYETGKIVEDHARDILEHEALELEALRVGERQRLEALAEHDGWDDHRLEHELNDAMHALRYLPVEHTWCDHDREDRFTLARHGVENEPARKAIVPGIDSVLSLLADDPVVGPRLLVVRGNLIAPDPALLDRESPAPTCFEDEVPGYGWGKSDGDRTGREAPVDKDNHGCDAVRYAIHSTLHSNVWVR